MSESENSELEVHEPAAFGQQLMLAREKAGMTIEEAARALNLNEETVEAIEDSALDKLPPVTYLQGYIRTYARLLGLSEEKILKEFEEEVPHQLESELVPRPPSPDGANSQTPIIKMISGLIIVLAAVVLFYAVYSYYIERTERIEQASHAGDDDAMTQMSPRAPLIEQPAEVTADEPLIEDQEPVPVEEEQTTLEPDEETDDSLQQEIETRPEELAETSTDDCAQVVVGIANWNNITAGTNPLWPVSSIGRHTKLLSSGSDSHV